MQLNLLAREDMGSSTSVTITWVRVGKSEPEPAGQSNPFNADWSMEEKR